MQAVESLARMKFEKINRNHNCEDGKGWRILDLRVKGKKLQGENPKIKLLQRW